MDVIYIHDLVVEGRHGVNQSEKLVAQPFRINLELSVDLTQDGQSDDLGETINWSTVKEQVIDVVQNNSFSLVERLASAIAERLLEDKRILKVSISVDKLQAFKSGTPGVKLERENTS